jgi:hypothetical protein
MKSMGELLEHRELNSGETIIEGRGFLLLLRPTPPWIKQQLNDHNKGIEVSIPRKIPLEGDNEGNVK